MKCWAVVAAAFSATAALAAAPDRRKGRQGPGLVAAIKVLPDKAPDCSSLKSIVESITRDCKTNDEKAIAIYNFMQLTPLPFAYPGEPGGLPVLKEINCYGWSLCGGLHSEQSALWRQLGWGWRFVGWNGHTTVEANYDGTVALPRRLPEVLRLEARPQRPGRPHHRRRRRTDQQLRRAHQERLRHGPGPQVRLREGQPVRPLRQQGQLAGPGAAVLRRRARRRDRRPEDAPSRRVRRGLGGHRPRRPRLLGRRQPRPGLRADEHLGRRARRLVLGRQQEAARRTPAAATRTRATTRASGWCWSRTSAASRPAAMPTAR